MPTAYGHKDEKCDIKKLKNKHTSGLTDHPKCSDVSAFAAVIN